MSAGSGPLATSQGFPGLPSGSRTSVSALHPRRTMHSRKGRTRTALLHMENMDLPRSHLLVIVGQGQEQRGWGYSWLRLIRGWVYCSLVESGALLVREAGAEGAQPWSPSGGPQ